MRFNKEKTTIKYNDSLTLSGIKLHSYESAIAYFVVYELMRGA
ncbi:hypothetical protein [Beggiatoa leptomitoformis]|nr:hypothetical protein [Beggiatoa leptomitoformis]